MITGLTDKEFITYLCGVLWEKTKSKIKFTDAELELVNIELEKRNIDHVQLDFMTEIFFNKE